MNNNFKIECTISPHSRNSKPRGGTENQWVCSKYTQSCSIKELADFVSNGHSWSHAVFGGERNKENFISSNLIALDIDNKNNENQFNVEDALVKCEELHLIPNIIYSSFSDVLPKGAKKQESLRSTRYRIIFVLDEPIFCALTFDAYLKILYDIFPADRKPNSASLWFGGKNLIYFDDSNLNELSSLKEKLITRATYNCSTTKTKKKKMKRLHQLFEYGYNGEKRGKSYSILKEQPIKEPIENFDWEGAIQEFDLLRKFENCQLKITHEYLFPLYLFYRTIKGGRKRFIKRINENPNINDNKIDDIVFYVDTSNTYYHEQKLENFLDFDDPILERYSYFSDYNLKRGQPAKLVVETENEIELDAASSSLKYNFQHAISDIDKVTTYVFKCALGLGKTQVYSNEHHLKDAIIALPTNQLAKEVSQRMEDNGVDHILIPPLPDLPDNIMFHYNQKVKVGGYTSGQAYLRNIVNHLPTWGKELDKRQETEKYFEAIDKASKGLEVIVMSHKRLLISDFQNTSMLIFDEDIFFHVYNIVEIDLSNFRILHNILKKKANVAELDIKIIEDLINQSSNKSELIFDSSNFNESQFENFEIIESIVVKHSRDFSGDILSFFKSGHFLSTSKNYKDPDGEKVIRYINVKLPKKDIKKIILSATVNKQIYNRMFGEIELIELDNIKHIGERIQYSNLSFSRSSLASKNNDSNLEIVSEYASDNYVITFKKFKSLFKNPAPEICIVNSSGTDKYNGKDIVVVGTPHLKECDYYLYATALGIEYDNKIDKLEDRNINHNGFIFRFKTFKNEELRNLQFYLIESSLQQASGRNRTIREDCKVTVFSNYPLEGFEQRNFNELKVKDNIININNNTIINLSGDTAA